jgi:hypothetical protein
MTKRSLITGTRMIGRLAADPERRGSALGSPALPETSAPWTAHRIAPTLRSASGSWRSCWAPSHIRLGR